MPKNLIEYIHQGQRRKTGEKFTSHLYAVRDILHTEGVTEDSILKAALLHDVLEDGKITKGYLVLKFGDKVAELVDLVSKKPSWKTPYCKMKSNLDEMENSWCEHPEAVLIKMADRLHNLQTIEGFGKAKQKEYLTETKQLLLPLFESILKKNPGYLKKYMASLLNKLIREVERIENRLYNPS